MKASKTSVFIVYTLYLAMSMMFFFFFLMAMSETEVSAIIGVGFFVGCIVLYHSSKFVCAIIDAYMKISVHIARKIEKLINL